jgi:mono/diheme cytochrome c family protein
VVAIVLLALLPAGCQEMAGSPVGVLQDVPSLREVAGTAVPPLPPVPTLAAEDVARGRQVYAQHCATCHGADLEGEADWQEQNPDGSFRAPPHNASGHTWHHADGLLIDSIARGGTRLSTAVGGTSPMPAFDEVLSDDEIAAVLAYIKSTWPADIQTVQWEMTVRSNE